MPQNKSKNKSKKVSFFASIFKQQDKRRLPKLNVWHEARKSGLIFILLVMTHIISIMHFENLSGFESIWLSFSAISGQGYSVHSPLSFYGRIITIVLIYFGAMIVMARFIFLLFEYRQQQNLKKVSGSGDWREMREHIIFFNAPSEDYTNYFYQAVRQLRHSNLKYHDAPVVIVSEKITESLPDKLSALDIVHIKAIPSDPEVLEMCAARHASIIIVLTHNPADPLSDSLNFDIIHRLREQNISARIIAEAVTDDNRRRLMEAGADNVIRPVRAYPEMVIRAALTPGIEQIIEELFSSQGEECVRYDYPFRGIWKEVVIDMVKRDIGTAIGYLCSETNKIFTNPPPNEEVTCEAIFVIVREGNVNK
ncbi:MAG: voltage-gated potassium channel [Alphaproteobacteria bacterium]|jgi:voltage-gated potassium channel